MRSLNVTLFVLAAVLAVVTGVVQAEETSRGALAHRSWAPSLCTTHQEAEPEPPMLTRAQPTSLFQVAGSGGAAAGGEAEVRWQLCNGSGDSGLAGPRAPRWYGADSRGQAGYQPR